MKSVRNLIAYFLAFAMAAFAVPGFAQNNKSYRLDNFPTNISLGANPATTVTVFNTSPAGNSNFNSFRLVAPSGIKITGAAKTGSVYGSNIALDPSANKRWVEVTNISPSVGRGVGFPLSLTLEGLTCGAGGAWVSAVAPDGKATEVWSGQLSGQQFANTTTPPTSTYVGTGAALAITVLPVDDSPLAVAVGAYTINVNVSTGCPTVIAEPTPVSLTGTNVTITPTTSVTSDSSGNSQFQATFGAPGTSVLTATAGSLNKTLTLDVFAKDGLDCELSTTPDPTTVAPAALFSASVPPGALPHDSGYAVGVRGPNKSGDCLLVGWTWTNNIKGILPTTDQLGRTVPVNGVSFVWDLALQPRATFLYTVTWKAEWLDATGVPSTTTDRCVDALCTTRAPVRACLGTALVQASMPNDGGTPTPVYDKACIVREVRATLPPGDPDYCTGTAPSSSSACVQFSTTFIDFDDPVFIR